MWGRGWGLAPWACGLGLGALGVLLGVLLSIFLAILGIFWYPIKRLVAKFRKAPQKNNGSR
jgi:hypothetical protein